MAAATGLPTAAGRVGARVGTKLVPKVAQGLRKPVERLAASLGVGTGAAPAAGAIEAGLPAEESRLGVISPEAAEDPLNRFAAGSAAAVVASPLADAVIQAGKPVLRRARALTGKVRPKLSELPTRSKVTPPVSAAGCRRQ